MYGGNRFVIVKLVETKRYDVVSTGGPLQAYPPHVPGGMSRKEMLEYNELRNNYESRNNGVPSVAALSSGAVGRSSRSSGKL
jgi:hypothetical protein